MDQLWLLNPLAQVDALRASGEDPVAFFQRLANEYLHDIPSLNEVSVERIPPHSLVRFRCMVQDIASPDYYLHTCEGTNTDTNERVLLSAVFRDGFDVPENIVVHTDAPTNVFAARTTMTCVSIPGESEWAKSQHAQLSRASPHVLPDPSTAAATAAASAAGSRGGQKRAMDEEEEDEEQGMYEGGGPGEELGEGLGAAMSAEGEALKRARTQMRQQAQARASAAGAVASMPAPAPPGQDTVFVHVYEEEPSLRVMDMVEFVGVYTLDPDREEEERAHWEGVQHNAPAARVPHMHAITYRKLAHNHPALEVGEDVAARVRASAGEARVLLHSLLSSVLFSDALASEYLLLHMLSHVAARMDDSLVLGKLALNIAGIAPEMRPVVASVFDVLQHLTTKAHLQPLSLEALEARSFTPKRDGDSHKLIHGMLQLADGTHLVLDELALQPGQLKKDPGIANLAALQNVIKAQSVQFDYPFAPPLFFPVNVPVLVLSEGKSLFQCDVHVPLVVQGESIVPPLSDEQAQALREYITALKAMAADFSIPEDVRKTIESDFVAMRQENPQAVHGETLHTLLGLARLHSLSKGEQSLSEETWHQVKSLETQRAARL